MLNHCMLKFWNMHYLCIQKAFFDRNKIKFQRTKFVKDKKKVTMLTAKLLHPEK